MTNSTDGYTPFLTPTEIYHQLREGKGPGSLNNAQFNTQMELPEETDRAALIASLADLIATGWQGAASAAAHGAVLPLRDHVLANADKLDRVQDLLSRQAGSFERAYNSVLPVPEVPRQRLDEAIPFDVDHAKEVVLYQLVAQHNIDVFGQYDGASEYNETNMPQEFHAGGRDGGEVSVRSADTIEVGEPRTGGEPEAGPPGGGPAGGFWPGGAESGSPAGVDAGGFGSGGIADGARPDGPADGTQPGGTANRARPDGIADGTQPGGPLDGAWPGGGAPGGYSGNSVGDASGSGAFRGVTESSGVLSPGGGQAVANDRSVGGFPSSGYSSPLAGGTGSVVDGNPSGGGAPRMGGGAVAGPVVRGPGRAVGAGALAAEENAVRRGAGIVGARGGAGPVGAPLGAGRGKDDEDTAHARKVLIEVDAEEMFGSDVLTAPSVIGDDEDED